MEPNENENQEVNATPEQDMDTHENINRLILGLTIGDTNAFAVVANNSETEIEILGAGACAHSGIDTKFGNAANCIRNAIADAEQNHGCKINFVIAGVTAKQIKGWNCSGVVAIKNIMVSHDDIQRAILAAKTNIPVNCEVLHMLSQEFILDEQGGITNPIGMNGIRLEVKMFMVTGAQTA